MEINIDHQQAQQDAIRIHTAACEYELNCEYTNRAEQIAAFHEAAERYEAAAEAWTISIDSYSGTSKPDLRDRAACRKRARDIRRTIFHLGGHAAQQR